MNVEASLPEVGPRLVAEWPDATAELRRIDAMWREALAESGGPFLFGAFGIVDAYFAPICVRARTYQLPLGAEADGLRRAHPARCRRCRNGAPRRAPSTPSSRKTNRIGSARRPARASHFPRAPKEKRTEVRFTCRQLPRRQRSQRCSPRRASQRGPM